MVLNLGVVLPREIPLHKVFVVTVSEEELVVLLVMAIDSNKHLVVCDTYSIEDLSTLNTVALLLRNTCDGLARVWHTFAPAFSTCVPATSLLALAHHHLLAPDPILRVGASHTSFFCQKWSLTWQCLLLQDSSWSYLLALCILSISLAVIPKTKPLWAGPVYARWHEHMQKLISETPEKIV